MNCEFDLFEQILNKLTNDNSHKFWRLGKGIVTCCDNEEAVFESAELLEEIGYEIDIADYVYDVDGVEKEGFVIFRKDNL